MLRQLKSLWVILQGEPVLTRTAVGAVLVALTQFGLPITDMQASAIDAVVVALLALNVRSKVSPVAPAAPAPPKA